MNLGMTLKKRRYQVDFLYVVRHTQIHLFDSVYSYWYGQAHLDLQAYLGFNRNKKLIQ